MAAMLLEVLLETPEAELRELLAESGHDFADLAARGRAAAQRALTKSAQESVQVEELHRGLGTLVFMLRRREHLSPEELALQARIDPGELRRIESDTQYTPSPRTVARLEDFFNLKPRSLAILAGCVRVQRGAELSAEVQRFAAMSSGMAKLSKEERRLLAAFVKLLSEYVE
jgi:transcriptional regulator with XRE-family HTH domain